MDDDFAGGQNALRWNPWIIVQPVQFEGEVTAKPRTVRLCCACCRVGDPVQVTDNGTLIEGRIKQSRIRFCMSARSVSQLDYALAMTVASRCCGEAVCSFNRV